MTLDLNALSRNELIALVEQAKERLAEHDSMHRQATRDKLIFVAEEAGYDIGALFGFGSKVSGSRKAKVVKYRHRTDAALTWGGRGKRP